MFGHSTLIPASLGGADSGGATPDREERFPDPAPVWGRDEDDVDEDVDGEDEDDDEEEDDDLDDDEDEEEEEDEAPGVE